MNQKTILEAVENSGLRQAAVMGEARATHFQGALDGMLREHPASDSLEEVKMIRQLLYIVGMYHDMIKTVVEVIDSECAQDIILEVHKDAEGVYSYRNNI